VARIDELDYSRLLGVSRQSSTDEIQQAFHAFARRYHPDAHTDDSARHARYVAVFLRGTEAYRVLRSPAARKAYDEKLDQGQLRYDGSLTRSSLPPPKDRVVLPRKRTRSGTHKAPR
jgi:DnaJ-class molecular chaperone